MRLSGSSVGLVAVTASLTLAAFGCSAILGIDNLPGPGDAGTDGGNSSGSASGGSSGAASSGGSSSGAASSSGAPSSSSGATASGSGSSGGATSGGRSSSGAASGSSGASSGATTSNLAAFLGTWQLTSGDQDLSNCTNPNADGDTLEPTTIQIVFTMGTTSDLVGTYQGQDSSGCSFKVNVSGNVATALPNQTCTEVGTSETDLLSLASYSFTLSGTASDEAANGTITDENDPSITCGFRGEATYAKLP
jgi:hypothetical protein